jgi:phosphotransferase system enzyme I (PtsI)
LLRNVIRECRTAGKALTLCGEMAGQPRAFVLLLGMGLRSFSMSPAFVPSIKELASLITIPQCEEILEHVLRLRTTANVKRYLTEQLNHLAPSLIPLDTA